MVFFRVFRFFRYFLGYVFYFGVCDKVIVEEDGVKMNKFEGGKGGLGFGKMR